jgi:hypothetical protein
MIGGLKVDCIGREHEHRDVPLAQSANEIVARAVSQHCIDHGHRRGVGHEPVLGSSASHERSPDFMASVPECVLESKGDQRFVLDEQA